MRQEGIVDIRGYEGADCLPLEFEPLIRGTLVVQGQEVELSIRPVVMQPTIKAPDGGYDSNGKRILFGIGARLGYYWHRLALLPLPSAYAAGRYAWEAQREHAALTVLAQYPDDGSVTMPLPNALQTDEVIYETTAPGDTIDRVVKMAAAAYRAGWLSETEITGLLARIHATALSSLDSLHRKGLKHNHPHTLNFNVDLATARARVFDYTLVTSDRHPQLRSLRTDGGRLTFDRLEEDDASFEASWQQLLERTGIDGIAPTASTDSAEGDTAASKLELLAAWRALRTIGIAEPTPEELRQLLAVQHRLIAGMPMIRYPLDTRGERTRLRIARAADRIQRLFREVIEVV